MKYDILKGCLEMWIEENEGKVKCKINPGEICFDLIHSIKLHINRIEETPKHERHLNRISLTSKKALEDIYQAIQEPENFNVQAKEKFNFKRIIK